ncbi:hypothetical protein [Mycolicibacterium mengxianglii]|uniref:hypothetical protein n=1 Tax=Mycolicibacterium mengxianglii TaxID=2736649 RepID=UPI001E6386A0|nr:hypothetical protein [Mycolicibacterium mengxianglii]
MRRRLDSRADSTAVDVTQPRGGRMRIPRSRGAASGLLLILLGLWGALIPFIGPYFDFAFSPDRPWVWTDARGWLEVLPGAVAVIGGLLLLTSRNRASATLGAWLGVIAGAWFVVGRAFSSVLSMGEIGVPAAATPAKTLALDLAFFSGLGAVIVFVAAAALGRLSIRSVRDVTYAQRTATDAVPATATTAAPTVNSTSGSTPVGEQKTEVIGPTAESKQGRNWRNLFRGNNRGDRGNRHTLVNH